jgi:predicted transcriptional regulator
MNTLTVQIDEESNRRLELLARTTERSIPSLISVAIRDFLEVKKWQIDAIEEGIREADAGNFATDEEVKATFAECGVNVG